jgi:hypothetical protein
MNGNRRFRSATLLILILPVIFSVAGPGVILAGDETVREVTFYVS